MSECPKCHSEVGKASYCGCGWKKKAWKEEDHTDPFPMQCAWFANGERCKFPGAISHNTTGHGPWYCGSHDTCKNPMVGLDIIENSHKYQPVNRLAQHKTEMADWSTKMVVVKGTPKHGKGWATKLKALIDAGLVKPTITVQRIVDEVLAGPIYTGSLAELELKKVQA